MDNELKDIIRNIPFEKIDKHPNILIAAMFWDDARYNAAVDCYRFMRMIDDMVDDRKASQEAFTCLEKQLITEQVTKWIACLDSASAEDPMIFKLSGTIEKFCIPLRLFHNFTRSMLFDVNHDGFASMDEFMEYTEGASVAPASVFVHLCCLTEDSKGYTAPGFDVVPVARHCARFSYLVHIIRDFQEDHMNNLNYFSADLLARNNLTPADLRDIAHGAPVTGPFRNLIREYYELADHYSRLTLLEIENLSEVVHGRYLLSLHIIYQLYRQVFDRIDLENGNFTTLELKPGPEEIRKKVLEVASEWALVRRNS